MRPYGVEAILRDDSGNWYSFTKHGLARRPPGERARAGRE